MAGRDVLCADLVCVLEQRLELQRRVADDAGVWCFAVEIRLGKAFAHAAVELGMHILYIERNADKLRRFHGIESCCLACVIKIQAVYLVSCVL